MIPPIGPKAARSGAIVTPDLSVYLVLTTTRRTIAMPLGSLCRTDIDRLEKEVDQELLLAASRVHAKYHRYSTESGQYHRQEKPVPSLNNMPFTGSVSYRDATTTNQQTKTLKQYEAKP